MKYKLLAYCLSCVLLVTCSDEEDPGPENQTIFELNIKPSYVTEATKEWVIISNTSGEVLGVSRFDNTAKVTIDSVIEILPDKINVTLLSYYPASTGGGTPASYFAKTYAGVETGSRWYLKQFEATSDPKVGSAKVNVSNFPANPETFASWSTLDGIGTTAGSNPTTGQLEISGDVTKDPDDVFLTVKPKGLDPKYFKANGLSPGSVTTVDYLTDFKTFDHTIRLPFETTFIVAVVTGGTVPMESVTSFLKDKHYLTLYLDGGSDFPLVYNDGYNFYTTFWSAALPDKSVSYSKIGEPPSASSTVMPTDDFNVLSTGLNDFNYSTTGQFHRIQSVHLISSGYSLRWEVERPIDFKGPILNQFPAAILSSNGELSTSISSLLPGGQVSFTKVIGGDEAPTISGLELENTRYFASESFTIYKAP